MVQRVFSFRWATRHPHGTEFHPQNNTNWNRITEAVYDFYQAMAGIGAENQVTLFSASEFGRTLTRTDLAPTTAGAATSS